MFPELKQWDFLKNDPFLWLEFTDTWNLMKLTGYVPEK